VAPLFTGQFREVSATPGAPNVILTEEYDAAGNRSSVSATVDEVDDFINACDYDGLGRAIIIDETTPSCGEFPLLNPKPSGAPPGR